MTPDLVFVTPETAPRWHFGRGGVTASDGMGRGGGQKKRGAMSLHTHSQTGPPQPGTRRDDDYY